jgi:hypothetical protein
LSKVLTKSLTLRVELIKGEFPVELHDLMKQTSERRQWLKLEAR